MPVRCDVAYWTFSGATVPLAVPAEPVSDRLGPPLDQNRRAKIFRVASPCAKIGAELASNDLLEGKNLLRMFLVNTRGKHHPAIRNFSTTTMPLAVPRRTFPRPN